MDHKYCLEKQKGKGLASQDKPVSQQSQKKYHIIKDWVCKKNETENQEYGIWLCDKSLKDKDWFLPRRRYPLTLSYMSRFDSEMKILKMPLRGEPM